MMLVMRTNPCAAAARRESRRGPALRPTGASVCRLRCGRGDHSPGADVAGVSPGPAQTWQGGALSRRRCGTVRALHGGPRVARPPQIQSCVQHIRLSGTACSAPTAPTGAGGPAGRARERVGCGDVHACARRGDAPGTRPLPHLHRDWAHHCHICTRTGLAPSTSAPAFGPPIPHLLPCHPVSHRDHAAIPALAHGNNSRSFWGLASRVAAPLRRL
jgi:hypothetical protein